MRLSKYFLGAFSVMYLIFLRGIISFGYIIFLKQITSPKLIEFNQNSCLMLSIIRDFHRKWCLQLCAQYFKVCCRKK